MLEAGYGAHPNLSDDLGRDHDPRFHMGAGVRVSLTDRLAARVDLRDVISDGFDKLGPHNIEAPIGLDWLTWSTKSDPAPAPVPFDKPVPPPPQPPAPEPATVLPPMALARAA
jgi:hypothetical protein